MQHKIKTRYTHPDWVELWQAEDMTDRIRSDLALATEVKLLLNCLPCTQMAWLTSFTLVGCAH